MIEPLLAEIAKVASTFTLAFFSFWTAIPAGLALGLTPLVVIATTTLSYASGVALITLFGGRIRDWIMRRLGQSGAANPDSRIHRIWRRYGLLGLGLAAPMTVGAQIGAALGIALDARPRRLFLAMSLGALVWSILLTAGVTLGLLGVQAAVGQ